MKLIDTSVWIPVLRRRPHPTLLPLIQALVRDGEAATSGPITVELLVGARDDAEYSSFQDELRGITFLATTRRTWRRAAELGFHLYRAGAPTGVPDLMIAAAAIEHDIVLVHADSDFDRIAQHSDLKVESYVNA